MPPLLSGQISDALRYENAKNKFPLIFLFDSSFSTFNYLILEF
jgi:hypothetical protein